jgi:hypothetical protein
METEKCFEVIKSFSDRAVQRGNVFNNMNDALLFATAYNQLYNLYQEQKKNGQQKPEIALQHGDKRPDMD